MSEVITCTGTVPVVNFILYLSYIASSQNTLTIVTNSNKEVMLMEKWQSEDNTCFKLHEDHSVPAGRQSQFTVMLTHYTKVTVTIHIYVTGPAKNAQITHIQKIVLFLACAYDIHVL